jgi:subtilisin
MMDLIDLDRAKRALAEGKGKGVKVAVIDSGIETSHPQLNGLELVDDLAVEGDGHKLRVVSGKGRDVYGHGTAVAGVLRALAPEVSIGSIRVLGQYNTSRTAIIQRGVQEALDRGYQILNCSFGCGVQSQVLQYKTWVDEAYLKGVHVVAACNNMDFTTQEWPAYFTSVISVNMARTQDETVFYYQRGTLIEFAAKGVNVKLPSSGGTQKLVTGSSYAVPRLAALVARMISLCPDLGPLETKVALHRLATPWSARVAAANV